MARGRHKATFEQVVEQYFFHLQDRRCTEATLRWRRYHLGRFGAWAQARWSSPCPADWPKSEDNLLFRRYLREVNSQASARGGPKSAAYVKTIQSSLRSFCRWMAETGRVESDLLAGQAQPRLPEKLTERFDPDEMQRLVAAARAFSRNPLRDVALVCFLFDTGCRAAEVCGLLEQDIAWAERRAKVTGKGAKERPVFFSPGMAESMRRYWAEERPGMSPYFFEREAGGKVTPTGLLSMCKRLSRLTGVHVHPHKFRHTFAIAYLTAGGDVFSLQKRLGHTTLAMSELYAKHLTDDLRREHDEHSPDQLFLGQRKAGDRTRGPA
jgi:site-specific recombinase XerD